ncbi:hypothetical protein [Kitasatospora sp. NPDC059599]|uniref:hypothetical protein n=1 Tax=Kitasatospora sp. NPDC059599 TaxID=3346880 RepID=UPI0036B9E2FF
MSTSEAPEAVTRAVQAARAVRELREIAHGWVDGGHEAPGFLIDAAIRAVSAGVDTPSLWHLAALGSSEHEQAPELFGGVMEELGFGFHPPAGYWEGRLALARWWAAEVVGGWLDPLEGISLIFFEVAEAYGWCEELAPVIDAVTRHRGRNGKQWLPQEVTADLMQVARELVARIPAPVRP